MRVRAGNRQGLAQVQNEVIHCTKCPRLTRYRQRVAAVKVRRYRDWEYWARPIPSFGDAEARVLILGLAPAAHGGNRTGRIFTGDRSGDWLFRALYRYGFANQPTSIARGDGLKLSDCYVTAALRCAPPRNRPLRQELEKCRPFLVRELALLPNVRVVVALGRIAFDAFLQACRETGIPLPRPRPRFAHGAHFALAGGLLLVASYHPSQQNTLTRRLTRSMFHAIFRNVRRLLSAREKVRHRISPRAAAGAEAPSGRRSGGSG